MLKPTHAVYLRCRNADNITKSVVFNVHAPCYGIAEFMATEEAKLKGYRVGTAEGDCMIVVLQ